MKLGRDVGRGFPPERRTYPFGTGGKPCADCTKANLPVRTAWPGGKDCPTNKTYKYLF